MKISEFYKKFLAVLNKSVLVSVYCEATIRFIVEKDSINKTKIFEYNVKFEDNDELKYYPEFYLKKMLSKDSPIFKFYLNIASDSDETLLTRKYNISIYKNKESYYFSDFSFKELSDKISKLKEYYKQKALEQVERNFQYKFNINKDVLEELVSLKYHIDFKYPKNKLLEGIFHYR